MLSFRRLCSFARAAASTSDMAVDGPTDGMEIGLIGYFGWSFLTLRVERGDFFFHVEV